jgi:hypothetical protein
VRVVGVPWRAMPSLRFVDSAVVGPILVAQKGGCCLASKVDQAATAEPEDLDADMAA